jgi:hypothetical protein
MADRPLGNDMLGEMLHFGGRPFEDAYFQAIVRVEMYVHAGDRKVVMIVKRAGQTPGQIP